MGKSPFYLFNRRLSGSLNRSGGCGEEKFLTLAEDRMQAVDPWRVTILTELSRFLTEEKKVEET
jgi:hypothetical protein